MKPKHFLPLILFNIAATLMVALALHHTPMPERAVIAQTTPLPTVTPTATPTPGWWDDNDFATPTLPKLLGVKWPAFSGLLLRLNLTTVPAGPLRLRLTAVDRTGNYSGPCVVRAGR